MEIVHIASELAPVAKVGGLGDAIYGLSKALQKKGHRVRIFLPKYDTLDTSHLQDLKIIEKKFLVSEENISIQNTLYCAQHNGLEIFLLDTHHPLQYFNRGQIYGEADDPKRFLFFCKAISKLLLKEQKPPDIIHLHDWPAAGATLFLKDTIPTLFTIHNMEHQGVCSPSLLESLEIEYDESEIQDPTETDSVNLLKAGIKYSTRITTVSPTYLKEIQTPEYGFGLEKELILRKKNIRGILNGIDTTYWDPQKDPHLTKNYSAEDVTQGKRANKQKIQQKLSLEPQPEKPLVVSVTRLAPQKGPDLIHYGLEESAKLGAQFVLLGMASEKKIHLQFEELKKQHEANPNIAIFLSYDEALSHLLYAGSDMFFMPSIFEPCGASQMIALRYGSIPLVRATGGLKDSVQDSRYAKQPNGFTFNTPDNKGVLSLLERAFGLFFEKPKEWQELVQRAMKTDLSWDASAIKYLELYKQIM